MACLSGCNYSNIQSSMSVSKLEQYRYATLKKIVKHNQKHRDCILNKLYTTIETMPIEWFEGDNHTSAYHYNGITYINKNFWRTTDDAIITIIHEAIHELNICGDDTVKQSFAICTLFDKPVYYSTDITRHIEDHLKEY